MNASSLAQSSRPLALSLLPLLVTAVLAALIAARSDLRFGVIVVLLSAGVLVHGFVASLREAADASQPASTPARIGIWAGQGLRLAIGIFVLGCMVLAALWGIDRV